MARYAYARWVSEMISEAPKEDEQAIRSEYFSNRGRVIHYDDYRKFCKAIRHEADSPPEDYYEWKGNPVATATGVGIGLLGIFGWFLGGIVGGSTGKINER